MIWLVRTLELELCATPLLITYHKQTEKMGEEKMKHSYDCLLCFISNDDCLLRL